MWETFRSKFVNTVTPGWLLVLDESMIKWSGVGMPGFMVVPRKPTPTGLELHTVCCAASGFMVNFEIYEGKERMARKAFVGDKTDIAEFPNISKSTALTLRCMEPDFGRGRVLIADSWFGSVPCALELCRHGVFCVMNVKTGCKGFPKQELMEVVGEIKGKSEEARQRRRARRGAQAAFVKKFKVGWQEVYLLAAGHNRKVPLLLVATHGTMLKGNEHVKKWSTPKADGTVVYHELRTVQTEVHALYRNNMHLIDLHNHLRQGVVSMADVWQTRSWVDRHFAELLGFIEVNIFQALTYFLEEYKNLKHPEFRKRLAHAFLTLGKHEFRDAETTSRSSRRESFGSMSNTSASATHVGPSQSAPAPHASEDHEMPWSLREHALAPFGNHVKHKCAYCKEGRSKMYCTTCFSLGRGIIPICGRRSGRDCIDKHATGAPIICSSWEHKKNNDSSAYASAPAAT